MTRPARITLVVAACVVVADQVTKAIAAHYLANRGMVDVLGGTFHLELYRNHGGPGGTLQDMPVLVSSVGLVAVAGMLAFVPRVRSVPTALALGLLLGGGVGNVLDRLLREPGPLRGGVVDWLKPASTSGSMNLADLSLNAALVVGLVGTLAVWWRERASRPSPPTERER